MSIVWFSVAFWLIGKWDDGAPGRSREDKSFMVVMGMAWPLWLPAIFVREAVASLFR